jgi:putative addiction module component (TIGR02574 family)
MSPSQLEQLLSLSVEDRIQLVEALWDSIADEPDSLPVTAAQRAELDRRLAEHHKDPAAARSWAQVRDELNWKYVAARNRSGPGQV